MKEKIYKLSNGGVLIYCKSQINNSSAVEVGFKVGAFNEKLKGSTHFLEHMLFKKTKNRSNSKIENDRSEIVFLNATTSSDYIILTFFRSNKLIENAMEFAGDVLLNSLIDDEFLETEKSVICEELKICKDAENRDIYVKNLKQAQSMPMFSSDIVGKKENNINKISFNDLVGLKREIFVGNNFVVSVASSLSFFKIKRLVDKFFTRKIEINPKFTPKRLHFLNNHINKQSSLKIVHTNQEKSSVLISFKINYSELELIENLNFSFIAKYFSGFQGDLFLKLRNKGLIYRINSDFICFYKDSLFNLYFETSKDKIIEVLDVISLDVREFIDNGISEKYINSFKNNYMFFEDEKMLKSMSQLAHENLMDYIYYGKIINFSKKQKRQMVANVSNRGIINAMKHIFDKNNKIFITVMGDVKEKDIPSLEQFKDKLLVAEE